jgi:hypothetical protein
VQTAKVNGCADCERLENFKLNLYKMTKDCKNCAKMDCRDNPEWKECSEELENFTAKLSSEVLWNVYRNTAHWGEVHKTHENLFRLGVEAVMFRGTELLNQFFSHKSDANKYLMAEEQEDLMKEFGKWCMDTCRYSDKDWISIKDKLPLKGQFVECKWNPEGENFKTLTTKEVLRNKDNMMLYGVTHWRRI